MVNDSTYHGRMASHARWYSSGVVLRRGISKVGSRSVHMLWCCVSHKRQPKFSSCMGLHGLVSLSSQISNENQHVFGTSSSSSTSALRFFSPCVKCRRFQIHMFLVACPRSRRLCKCSRNRRRRPSGFRGSSGQGMRALCLKDRG